MPTPNKKNLPQEETSPYDTPLPPKNSLTTDLPEISPYGNENEKKKKIKGLKYIIPAVLATVVICIVGFSIFSNSDDISQQTVTESYEEETEGTTITAAAAETETVATVDEKQYREPDGHTPPQTEETSSVSDRKQSPPDETGTAVSRSEPNFSETQRPAEASQTPPSQTKPEVTEPTKPAATSAAPAQTKPAQEKIPDKVKIGKDTYNTSMTGELDLSQKKLTNSDIVNLKYMTKITELNLNINDLSDISPIANLTSLKMLYLNYNSISDLSPLAKLTSLEKLYLKGNNISDLSSLAKLTNLEILLLNENSISDISPLKNLTKITELDLSTNKISDISPLSNYTDTTIEKLILKGNRISDLSPLSKCKLQTLVISDNPLNGDLKAFKGLNFHGKPSLWYSLNIRNCGYDKYIVDGAMSKEFDDAILDSIKFDKDWQLEVTVTYDIYPKYKNKK